MPIKEHNWCPKEYQLIAGRPVLQSISLDNLRVSKIGNTALTNLATK
jgi:hypothetical protein